MGDRIPDCPASIGVPIEAILRNVELVDRQFSKAAPLGIKVVVIVEPIFLTKDPTAPPLIIGLNGTSFDEISQVVLSFIGLRENVLLGEKN